MRQAEALVIPSIYESLSLVLLESFALKVPVIASAGSDVLKDHIDSSKGGWYYKEYDEFKNILEAITKNKEESKRKGELGFAYVQQNYTWPRVMEHYQQAIEDVSRQAV